MAANFSFEVKNEDLKGQTTENIAYTQAPKGNSLDLTLTNRSGRDLSIAPSTSNPFTITISRNILTADGFAGLTFSDPWSIQSKLDNGSDPYSFSLSATGGSVPFSNDSGKDKTGPLVIQLQNFNPTASIDDGQLVVSYDFGSLGKMKAPASLTIKPYPIPGGTQNVPLIGDGGLLNLSVIVNGQEGNPVIVSRYIPTEATRMQNTIELSLVYNDQTSGDYYPGDSASWDDSDKPTLSIYFPYQCSEETLPAPLCLTDDFPVGEGYNTITSAQNIWYSLDAAATNKKDNPQNGFWQIETSTEGPMTAWHITPLNKKLFSTGKVLTGDPGPFLNVFLSNIVSALTIDPDNAQTLLYINWRNFPGYTDGGITYMIQKEYLSINEFSGTIKLDSIGTRVFFLWNTENADHCLITGESALQAPQATLLSPCVETITSKQPMQSAYTLTAVGKGGITTTATVGIDWNLDQDSINSNFVLAKDVFVRPDEDEVVMMDGGGIFFLNGDTFNKWHALPGDNFSGMVLTQDGTTIFAIDGNGLYAFDAYSLQLIRKFISGTAGSFSPVVMVANGDGSIIASLPINNGNLPGEVQVYNAATLQPLKNLPVVQGGCFALAIGPKTGNYFLAAADHIDVLNPDFTPASGSPVNIAAGNTILISPDEKYVYILSGYNPNAMLTKVDASTLAILKSVQVSNALSLMTGAINTPTNPLVLSPDGSQLFMAGMAGENWQNTPSYSAFDTATLTQSSWDIGAIPNFLVTGLALAPLSYRIFVTGFQFPIVKGAMYAIDAGFIKTS